MSILSFNFGTTGEAGLIPRIVRIKSNDSLSSVTAAGWANALVAQGNTFYVTDEVHVNYGTDSASFGIFTPTVTGMSVTLNPSLSPGEVILPVVSNNVATFSGTSGAITDGGYKIIAGSISWAGGSTSHGFTIAGLTTASIVLPSIKAQSASTAILSWVASANTLTVAFSGDPGAMELAYIGVSASIA